MASRWVSVEFVHEQKICCITASTEEGVSGVKVEAVEEEAHESADVSAWKT